jgi:hypothetical protein
MDASPLAMLSLELRMKIYGDVVNVKEPIHVIATGDPSNSEWKFLRCDTDYPPMIFGCDRVKANDRLDAILMTCKQIRDEALREMFTSNVVRFDVTRDTMFSKWIGTLRHWLKYIKSMIIALPSSVGYVYDDTISIFRAFCSAAAPLRHLTILAFVRNELAETMLDRFRLLSALNLTTATVQVSPLGQISSESRTAMEQRVQKILTSGDVSARVKAFNPSTLRKVGPNIIHSSHPTNKLQSYVSDGVQFDLSYAG